MDNLPTRTVIARDNRLYWRISGHGLVVEECSGERAHAAFNALCHSHGLQPLRWQDPFSTDGNNAPA